MRQRPGDQQLPTVNDQTDCQQTLLARLVDDIPARRQVGIERYGTGLQPFNGRDAGRDAYEEWLDLGAYLEQLRRERAELETQVRRDVAAEIARTLESYADHEIRRLGGAQLVDSAALANWAAGIREAAQHALRIGGLP